MPDAASHLESGHLPIKFGYLKAHAHTEHAASTGYDATTHELGLDHSAISSAVAHFPTMPEWVDLGPGDGTYIRDVMLALPELPPRTLLLDFSRELLAISSLTLEAAGIHATQSTEWDFEGRPTKAIRLWREVDRAILVTLLGNTLANVESETQVLLNIANSMRRGDLLVIGVARATDEVGEAELLAPYRSVEFAAAVHSGLMSLGLEGSFDFDVSLRDGDIVGRTSVSRLTRVPSALGGALRDGSIIRTFLSRRYTATRFAKVLESRSVFCIESLGESKTHLTAVVRRTGSSQHD